MKQTDEVPVADQIAIAHIVKRSEPEVQHLLGIERHQREADFIELGDRASVMHLFDHVINRIEGLGWFVCNVRGDYQDIPEEDT